MTLHRTGLLFVPRHWQRAHALRWLKRVHAWTGLWGALLFLLLGSSGFLLNHRDVLKIDTGEPVEVSAMEIAVPPGSITDAKALGRWAQAELGLTSEPRPPRGGGPGEAPGGKRFLGKERPEARPWELNFNHPNGRVTVAHVPGSASVSVKQSSPNLLGLMKNLHKGSGVSAAWVLFMDTIAGALLAMALTGFLLWSHLHGPRLIAGAIVVGSLSLATVALWPTLI